MEVTQAAGSRGVAVVDLGWRLHRHETGGGTGKGRRAARPGGREGEPWIYILYLFPPFISRDYGSTYKIITKYFTGVRWSLAGAEQSVLVKRRKNWKGDLIVMEIIKW